MSALEKPVANSPKAVTATLARFMRTNYGNAAETEAIRHVAAYTSEEKHDLAEIWLSVVEELKRIEASSSALLTHKAKGSLS